jgi:hypothetical protein
MGTKLPTVWLIAAFIAAAAVVARMATIRALFIFGGMLALTILFALWMEAVERRREKSTDNRNL